MSANKAIAKAPASIGNVAVGFDVLGLALSDIYDSVEVEKRSDKKVIIESLTGLKMNLPQNPEQNTCGAAVLSLQKKLQLNFGFSLRITKGIPLASGMGGSAASAVAAVVAANALLEKPLEKSQLLELALAGETVASGSAHLDNVAPSMLGGLILCLEDEVVQIPTPELFCTIIHPHIKIETKKAREVLSSEVPLKTAVSQSQNLAGFLVSCYEKNYLMMQRNLHDLLIEPQRKVLIPGFNLYKDLALNTKGCLGSSISGAGPTLFALCQTQTASEEVARQWRQQAGSTADVWSLRPDTTGAFIHEVS